MMKFAPGRQLLRPHSEPSTPSSPLSTISSLQRSRTPSARQRWSPTLSLTQLERKRMQHELDTSQSELRTKRRKLEAVEVELDMKQASGTIVEQTDSSTRVLKSIAVAAAAS